MQLLKIPLLEQTTDQTLDVTINDNPYTLRVLWNERFGYFSLSVLDLDGSDILTNVKMISNWPLTERFKDQRLPAGSFYFIRERGRKAYADYDALETEFGLYYYEPDAKAPAAAPVLDVSAPVIGSIWDSGLSEWDAGDSLWDQ